MKVLVVTNMYPTPEHRYYGIFVKEQVDSLIKAGVDVEVLATQARGRRSAYLTDVRRLAHLLREDRFDIVHAHHSYSVLQCVAAFRLARRRLPIVFTFHEGETMRSPEEHERQDDWLKRLVYSRRIKRVALHRATVVISVAEGLPEAAGFSRDYLVGPPGVDLDLFRPRDRAESRTTLSMDLEGSIVLFPADPQLRDKGVDLLRAALELIDGVQVEYGGAIPHETMPLYMNAADAVIQTSRFEASPMVVKEAMACNRPIVSTNVGDVASIFGDANGCFVTDRTPQAVAAAITSALRIEGPVEGRQRLKQLGLSLEDVAARLVTVYAAVRRRPGL